MKKFFEIIKKKWIADTTRVILLVALLVVAYLAINMLADKFNLPTLDFTEEKLYSVSDESKEKVKDIDQEVTIYFFGADENTAIIDFAKQYTAINNKIKVEVVDSMQRPDLLEKYGISDNSSAIVVQSPERSKIISAYDLSSYNYTTGETTDLTEEKVTNAIIETTSENGETVWQDKYGLIAYSPIAKNYPFEHYDDFGAQRTYGYKRQHLGHDLMAQTGTPVIAIESGIVEAVGWNQYGGWRLGIRSLDGTRYYYYAHLRQNRPYAEGIEEGKVVKAGDVIGYVGHTGYSTKENANNIEVPHLHLGMQLIFDESQKESSNEIWINLYPLTMLWEKHKSEVYRVDETKEYYRKYNIRIPGIND